jgi:hypothetical protein
VMCNFFYGSCSDWIYERRSVGVFDAEGNEGWLHYENHHTNDFTSPYINKRELWSKVTYADLMLFCAIVPTLDPGNQRGGLCAVTRVIHGTGDYFRGNSSGNLVAILQE